MIQKELKKLEIKKDRYEFMLSCNDQFKTNYKFYVYDGRYFDITNLDNEKLLDLINTVSKVIPSSKKVHTHTVRNPFYSKMSQFEPGKQSLSVGIDIDSLTGFNVDKIYIGRNRNVYYKIDAVEARRLTEEYKSMWINPRGRKVAILPLKDFIKVERKTK